MVSEDGRERVSKGISGCTCLLMCEKVYIRRVPRCFRGGISGVRQ